MILLRSSPSRWARGSGALLAICLTPACSATKPAAAEPVFLAEASSAEPPSYAGVASGAELAERVRADLAQHQPEAAYDKLRLLAASGLEAGRETATRALFAEARLVPLFLHRGGAHLLGAVEALEGLLVSASDAELESAYGHLYQGDTEAMRAALGADGPLSPAARAALPVLDAHAALFEGALDYHALEAGEPGAPSAIDVDLAMERAAQACGVQGLEREFFLARIYAGLALERGGNTDLAIERWLEATESAYWEDARHDLRLKVAGRIESYRAGLRAEVESEVAEEHARRVAEIEARHQAEHALALERVAALEAELARLGARASPASGTLPAGVADSATASAAGLLAGVADAVTIAQFLGSFRAR
jgi:hypothetical protein